jgi:phospholipid/cholesterol/gamma-HCH transport system substrate-binding protein
MKRSTIFTIICGCMALCLGAVVLIASLGQYQLQVIVPSAAQVVRGAQVRVGGTPIGHVTGLAEKDGRAVVTATITDHDYTPMHDGTTARIAWQSVLGERYLELTPGPASNPALPSGAMYRTQAPQVEFDEVLASLDTPTRLRLNSLITGLRDTLGGHEPNIQASLRSAGPAVDALGEILAGVGRDGPAINTVVTQLHEMAAQLAGRQDDLSGTINNLTDFTGNIAGHSDQLSAGLAELPPTLDAARTTLDKIPAATDATVPLLHDLRPATDRLPSLADNLSPVMHDLNPVLDRLRPTLSALNDVLDNGPDLFSSAHATLPPIAHALHQLGPAAYFLRPYTPELMAFIGNFGGSFSSYDGQGHGWSVSAVPGPASLGEQLGATPVSAMQRRPAPGSSVGQPWTDAYGDGYK